MLAQCGQEKERADGARSPKAGKELSHALSSQEKLSCIYTKQQV